MTPEHEEAVRLAKKHGAAVVSTGLFMHQEELAALIADVRRQAIEEDAEIADKWASNEQRKWGNGGPKAEILARLEVK